MMKFVAVTLASLAFTHAAVGGEAFTEFETNDAHVIVVRPLVRWTGNSDLMDKSLKAVGKHSGCFINFLEKNGNKESSCRNFFGLGSVASPDSKLVNKTLEVLVKLQPEYKYSDSNSGNYMFVQPPLSLTRDEYDVLKQIEASASIKAKIDEGDPDTLSRRVFTSRMLQNILDVAITGAFMNSSLGAQNGFTVASNAGTTDIAKSLAPKVGGAFAPVTLPPLDEHAEYRSIDVRRLDVIRPGLGQIVIAYKREKTPDAELDALSQAIAVAMEPQMDEAGLQAARESDFADRRQFWTECKANRDCFKE